jgi:hypothetical protein
MATVLEVLAFPDLEKLDEISEELDGILSTIAFGAHPSEWEFFGYIISGQNEMRKKYDKIIEKFGEDKNFEFTTGLGTAVGNIVDAYHGLMNLIDEGLSLPYSNSDNIRQEAEDILYENLLIPHPDEFN